MISMPCTCPTESWEQFKQSVNARGGLVLSFRHVPEIDRTQSVCQFNSESDWREVMSAYYKAPSVTGEIIWEPGPAQEKILKLIDEGKL